MGFVVTGDQATPRELLRTADQLLGGEVSNTQGLWPRAVAFLIRLALERAVDELLDHEEPAMRAVQVRSAKIICLPRYADAKVAAQVAYLWHELSRATHYQAYDLAPTAVELRRWHSEVAELVQLMGAVSTERLKSMPARTRDIAVHRPQADSA
jgi:hypothetical protein